MDARNLTLPKHCSSAFASRLFNKRCRIPTLLPGEASNVPSVPYEDQNEAFIRQVVAGRAEIACVREQAQRRAREAETEIEALILGTKRL